MMCPQKISRSLSLDESRSRVSAASAADQPGVHFSARPSRRREAVNSRRKSSIPMAWVVVETPNRPMKGSIKSCPPKGRRQAYSKSGLKRAPAS